MEVNNYELMIVAKTGKSDSLLTRVEKAIKGEDIKDVKVDNLGKKPLAYPIKGNTDATYFVLNFDALAESIKPISDTLRLEQDELLRYLFIKRKERGLKAKSKKVVQTNGDEKAKPKVTVAVKSQSKVKSKTFGKRRVKKLKK